jgi:hypothetical protein
VRVATGELHGNRSFADRGRPMAGRHELWRSALRRGAPPLGHA